ncbi:hypothetical protein [Polaribacter sp. Asnod6-C07]|uniref:hypothetical protein n=1 Tax=Polaribacter sp. Asnod6-C07 TaxID=3160582 RepID=UPI0038632198
MLSKININTRIIIICLTSLIWIFLYKLVLIDLDEIFPKAREIAELTFGLLSSVIASCIFYYIVVYLERKRMSKILFPSLNKRLKVFGIEAHMIKSELFKLNNKQYKNEKLLAGDIMNLCHKIKLSSIPPEIFGNPSYQASNWYEYFEYFFQSDKFHSSQLYNYINYLTPDILKELDNLQLSHFQSALHHYKSNPNLNDLSGLGGPFWLYLESLEKISKAELK